MKAYDYDAVVFDGACYCLGCLPEGVSEDDEEVAPIFASEEVDSYPTCDGCGAELDYMCLTDEGRRWLAERDERARREAEGEE